MITQSSQWLKRDNESAFALTLAGMTLAELDERSIAEKYLTQAVSIQPNYPAALAALGGIALAYGEGDRANEYHRACANFKDVGNSFTGAYKAVCKARLGDKSSISDIEQYLEQNPTRSWLHLVAALIYTYLQEPERARQSASRSLELNPQSGMAHSILALSYLTSSLPRIAMWHAETALSISPKSPTFAFTAVAAAIASHNVEATKKYFALLSEISPMRANRLRAKLPANRL